MAENHFDLIVIGGGPGGYVAAIRAAQLGLRTACVERDKLGGTCLNWGCIPTKALLKNAELFSELNRHGKDWGIEAQALKVNWEKVIGRSRGVADTLNKGIHYLFKKNNIAHFAGHGKITRAPKPTVPGQVQVSEKPGGPARETITATNIIIATGAVPRPLPFAPFDGETIISSKEAMILPKQPKSMVIVGAGAIGVEFAYFYNAFGTRVTLVEMLDRLLPVEDDEVSKALEREFKKDGIDIRTGTVTKAIDKTKGGAKVTLAKVADEKKTDVVEAEVVLVAIGVQGRYDGLFDDSLGIATEKQHIKVPYRDPKSPSYQTSVPGIFAIGDVIGPPWLAHVASEEGVVCVERLAGHKALGVDYTSIPGCTYCHPQVASIGFTERALKEQGMKPGEDYTVGTYQLKPHGKAIAAGANVGFVKILASKPHGEILGAHIIGDQATELIAEIGLARSVEATIDDVIHTMHAHPTMSEAIHEAALGTQNRMIHA